APMSGLAVQAVGADSLAHVGVTDSDGIYALRYLPGGAYQLRAFEDVNRDYALDRNEPRGLADFDVAAGDTAFVDVSVRTPDTMAAVLGSAQALDSVTVVLSFDDFLDPAAPIDSVEVSLASDSVAAPGVVRLFHEAGYAAW